MKNKKRILLLIRLCSLIFSLVPLLASAQSHDPLYSKQWALENTGQIILKNITELERIQVKGTRGVDINWVDTSLISAVKKEVIVAVLDSGLDLEHPDLVGRIWFNQALCAGFGPSIPANRSCYGHNFLDNNTILTDEVGHGTHVAGIIAANRNNIGIAGAADPRIKIMPLKVLNDQVNGFVYNGKVITDVIADAMIFAIKNGADVINLSLGWPKLIDLPKVRNAFEMAEKNNVVVIAASGNNNKDLPTFPCSYENVVCVGAIDNRGELTDFSNHGSKVDIVAPGESIISTFPRKLESRVLRVKNYESKRGSSQAAPYVAAAVANLKLLHPQLSNDQVRSLLYRSSTAITESKSKLKKDRFVKFGMLNMKALLDLAAKEGKENKAEATAFVNPQIKSVTEIKWRINDKKFSFQLNLKNISATNYQGKLCLNTKSEAITLDQKCIAVETILGGETKSIAISGSILDMNHDSHILLELQIDERAYKTSLVFSRDLNQDSEVISNELAGASFEDMAFIRGDRRGSIMTRVFDKQKAVGFPEYFYLEKLKQTATASVVSLLTKSGNKSGELYKQNYVIKNLKLPKVNRVLSIHRQDINQDGKLDYFIYTLSNKEKNKDAELIFFLFDEKLNPLFSPILGGKSQWMMALSTFEGLPIDGGQEKFEWIKVKNNDLGTILVPSIYRNFLMPEADNSKRIGERIIGGGHHQYYLNPVLKDGKVIIDLRVIDSVKMMTALREKLNIKGAHDAKSVFLLKPFPQTQNEYNQGIIRSLVAIEDDGFKAFAEITLKLDNNNNENNIADFNFLKNTHSAIDQSLIYPVIDLLSGEITSESVFTALLNRSSAEFMIKAGKDVDSLLVMKEDWENPIIGLLGTYNQSGRKMFLIESRSSLLLLDSDGVTNSLHSSLPIYRDSSFPGQNFSETLTTIMVQGRPGVYVNSTLIYGERIYSMMASDRGLIRPMSLSVSLPAGCVPLLPETLESKQDFNYVFLCTDSQSNVKLIFLPLSRQ